MLGFGAIGELPIGSVAAASGGAPAPRLYFVVHPTSTWSLPTGAQIVAGQIGTGAAALSAGNELAPTTTGLDILATLATGLTVGVSYTGAMVWYDGTTYSNVATNVFTLGRLKVWDGAAWVVKPAKVWDGAAWAIKPVKYYNGTSWVT
jgi:hypothetical protein